MCIITLSLAPDVRTVSDVPGEGGLVPVRTVGRSGGYDAGAIPPPDAFEFAFRNGADFILAGMFDFEIADDVQTAKNVLAKVKDRARPWCA